MDPSIEDASASHPGPGESTDPRRGANAADEALVGSTAGADEKTTQTGTCGPLDAILDSEVGRNLERSDRLYLALATQQALETLPSGQAAKWCNPDTGNSGTVVSHPAELPADGQYYRDLRQTVTAGGQTQQAYGIACRQPDGTWRVVHDKKHTARC